MRPARIIVAATLAAVAIATVSYLALSTNTHHPAAAPDTAPTSPVVQTPTTGNPTNPEPAVLADGRHPVLLKTIDPGRGTVTFDLIQYFHGDQATIEAAKDHQEFPPPNDTYSRNLKPQAAHAAGASRHDHHRQPAGRQQPGHPGEPGQAGHLDPRRQRDVLDHRAR
jgi:hypothetical protein